jgi:hypothetical protein
LRRCSTGMGGGGFRSSFTRRRGGSARSSSRPELRCGYRRRAGATSKPRGSR